jgi:hypothetical protein
LSRILFRLGRLVATPRALTALGESKEAPLIFLRRHASGDWGSLGREDAAANTRALKIGGRLLSAYYTAKGVKLWIITEADRSSTCILLPADY